MDRITIQDLGVLCRIGVPDEERAKPQRLLVTIAMESDFGHACANDEIGDTINYFDVSRRVIDLCQNSSFKLLERLAQELAQMILQDFRPQQVTVEIKKFIITEARYISFQLSRDLSASGLRPPTPSARA
jgi:7,8-dihydroneopterin aldolase/epimerase/oxygenase